MRRILLALALTMIPFLAGAAEPSATPAVPVAPSPGCSIDLDLRALPDRSSAPATELRELDPLARAEPKGHIPGGCDTSCCTFQQMQRCNVRCVLIDPCLGGCTVCQAGSCICLCEYEPCGVSASPSDEEAPSAPPQDGGRSSAGLKR